MDERLTEEGPRQIGRIVRRARTQRGLSQAELAGLCRVGTRFVSELEAGKPTLQLGKAMAVLRALGLALQITPAVAARAPAGGTGLVGKLLSFRRKSEEAEARTNLAGAWTAMTAARSTLGRFPRTFSEAGWSVPNGTRYAYFLGEDVVGGDGTPERSALVAEARRRLRSESRRPGTRRGGFLIAAATLREGREGLDLWTIDEARELRHLTAEDDGE